MSANQRPNPLHGGGNSPAFSSEDALRAAGMGITFSPADVLAMKQEFVIRAMPSVGIVLSTLRKEVESRKLAEKRVVMLEDAIREHTSTFDRATAYLAERPKVLRSVERWKRLAFLSVPVLAIETAIILWMVTR